MHKDKLKTGVAKKAYKNGYDEIDWSVGRAERDANIASYRSKYENHRGAGLQVIPDIEPFIDPIDGNVIGGNRQKREFMRQHGVIDCGDERVKTKKTAMDPVNTDIRRAIAELESR